eukprot:m.230406 g.230406  ORF g.230406 m.230406 type:complete len:467 (-) comp15999_c0_seq8:4321-5721(-)
MASQVAEKDRPEFLAGLLKGLRKHVARLERNEGKLYTENYAKLKQVGLEQLSSVACDNSNTYKNRYRNVLAYDSSRVVLEDGREGDYINANWVPGLTDPKRYIATQGPVPTTIIDFWSMIWQVQASIIVKVTREVENGVLKCHRYWPDPSSEPPQRLVLLGNVEVEFNSAEVHDTYIIRKFTLRKGSQQRSVQQFSYEAWPDHGVPLTTREFLDFRRIVKKASDGTRTPMVVHCSAGVGRTGTYITVDRVLEAVEKCIKSNNLDIDYTVTALRKARCFMVQTIGQYIFCFQALLDGIRETLQTLEGSELTSETRQFLLEDQKEALHKQQLEDKEIAALKKGKVDSAVATDMEIKKAETDWNKKDDPNYDTVKEMTTIESRCNALIQSGSEIDMSPAHPDQIRQLVLAAKRLRMQHIEERNKLHQANSIRQVQADKAIMEKKKEEQKQEERKRAQQKANKFLAKFGS